MKIYVFNFLVGFVIAAFGLFSGFTLLMAFSLIPYAMEEDTQSLFLGYTLFSLISSSLFIFFMIRSNYFDRWLR
jgi:hypothetical protein